MNFSSINDFFLLRRDAPTSQGGIALLPNSEGAEDNTARVVKAPSASLRGINEGALVVFRKASPVQIGGESYLAVEAKEIVAVESQ